MTPPPDDARHHETGTTGDPATTTAPEVREPHTTGDRPATPSKARRVRSGAALAVDIAIPVGLYYVLRWAGLSYQAALLVSALAPGVSGLLGLRGRRGPSHLSIFVSVMTVATVATSLISDSPRFLLAKEGVLALVSGVWILVSARNRPLVLPFARALLGHRVGPGRPGWDVLWERLPRFRRLWRVVGAMWGVGLILDAVVRIVMAYTLPVDAVPALNLAQYAVFVVLMQVVTNLYMVPAGLYNPWSRLYEPLRRERDAAAAAAGAGP
ncbi:VC0807 family protein [Sphaerisporangium sp. TRM90804]|uniref:VC0807 family protein n=1 Tax=Sphaerisporangium sp. TRM90804 TaxID=3031113 RepID=UPI00244A2BFA|nr:VC0807 family protein [Sphaerisporangium sp. TRM90804]MDH2427520.1 hypothetical protein [Sphaerisporangium sp. TRM90804]